MKKMCHDVIPDATGCLSVVLGGGWGGPYKRSIIVLLLKKEKVY